MISSFIRQKEDAPISVGLDQPGPRDLLRRPAPRASPPLAHLEAEASTILMALIAGQPHSYRDPRGLLRRPAPRANP